MREISKPYLTHLKSLQVHSDTPFESLYRMDDISISALNKGTGSKARGMSLFAIALVDIISFFGDDAWSDSQILDTAEIFYDECYWFCFPELKHFVKKCKSLKFGKIFGRFNTATFIDWMAQYSSEAHEKRAGYFGKIVKSTWVEPANIVPQEVVTEFISGITTQMLLRQANEEAEAHKIRQANMQRQQEQLKAIIELRNTAKDE